MCVCVCVDIYIYIYENGFCRCLWLVVPEALYLLTFAYHLPSALLSIKKICDVSVKP